MAVEGSDAGVTAVGGLDAGVMAVGGPERVCVMMKKDKCCLKK